MRWVARLFRPQCTCGGIRVAAYPGGPDIKPPTHFTLCPAFRSRKRF